jgi:hypothetical protein
MVSGEHALILSRSYNVFQHQTLVCTSKRTNLSNIFSSLSLRPRLQAEQVFLEMPDFSRLSKAWLSPSEFPMVLEFMSEPILDKKSIWIHSFRCAISSVASLIPSAIDSASESSKASLMRLFKANDPVNRVHYIETSIYP